MDSQKKILVIFILTLAVVFLLRMLVFFFAEPRLTNDSRDYLNLARLISSNHIERDNGARTPVYPIVIILLGFHFKLIILFQLLLGIGISALLFILTAKMTGNGIMGSIIALLYGLNPFQIKYEISILADTLSAFLLLLMVFSLFEFYESKDANLDSIGWKAIIAGVSCVLAALTRPAFALIVFFVMPFIFLLSRVKRTTLGRALKISILFALPAVIGVGGLSAFNLVRFGAFSPSLNMGISLSNHSGAFMEHAPDEYRTIRRVYLKHRRAQVHETGGHSQTIWRALDEIMSTTGMTYSQVMRRLTKLSLILFVKKPLLYLRSVARSWISYWNTPDFNLSFEPRISRVPSSSMRWVAFWGILTRFAQRIQNLTFFFCLFLLFMRFLLRKQYWSDPRMIMAGMLLCMVFLYSITQALMEHGENFRYSLPMQPITLLAIVAFFDFLFHSKKSELMRGVSSGSSIRMARKT